tara:strand:+ start:167 stop:346 length:180 start_codon:yes stop_codon:yes gene_type:complete
MSKDNKVKAVYTVPVIEVEDGELGFELPDDLMLHLNLKTGDTLIWEQTELGWAMRKDNG